jgi:hypothetical protein
VVFPEETTKHPKGFRDMAEFLTHFAKSLTKVAAKDSFALIYHSQQQEALLMKTLEIVFKELEIPVSMHHFYSVKKGPGLSSVHSQTRHPLNCVERALHLVIGNPGWANYGTDKDTEEPKKFILNYSVSDPKPSRHPFHKPEEDYIDWVKYFSLPRHNVLEAFAGSCPSILGCLMHGRNLTLVEKSKDFAPLFKQKWADYSLHFRGGKNPTHKFEKEDVIKANEKKKIVYSEEFISEQDSQAEDNQEYSTDGQSDREEPLEFEESPKKKRSQKTIKKSFKAGKIVPLVKKVLPTDEEIKAQIGRAVEKSDPAGVRFKIAADVAKEKEQENASLQVVLPNPIPSSRRERVIHYDIDEHGINYSSTDEDIPPTPIVPALAPIVPALASTETNTNKRKDAQVVEKVNPLKKLKLSLKAPPPEEPQKVQSRSKRK